MSLHTVETAIKYCQTHWKSDHWPWSRQAADLHSAARTRRRGSNCRWLRKLRRKTLLVVV